MDDILPYYELLELQPGATQDDIKQAYRKQAKRWHPDRFPGNVQKQQEAEERIKALNIAYEYLRKHAVSAVASQPASQGRSPVSHTAANPRYHTKQTQAETYYQEGAERVQSEDYQGAVGALSMAIRLDPNYADAYRLRSIVFSYLGYDHRSKSDRAKAVQLDLENAARSPFRSRRPSSSTKAPRSSSSTPSPPSSSTAASASASSPPQSATPPESSTSRWQCQQTLLGHTKTISDLAFARRGKLLVSSSLDGHIVLWNVATGDRIGSLTHQVSSAQMGAVHSVAVSADGQFVASGSADGAVRLWYLQTGSLIRAFGGMRSPILAVAISPNRKVVAIAYQDGSVQIWDAQFGKRLHTLTGHKTAVEAIAINPNGLTVVSSSRDAVRFWDLQTGQCIHQISTPTQQTLALDFSPNRRDLLLGHDNGTIQLWDTETHHQVYRFEGHHQAVHAVAFSPDGRQFASGGGDRTVRVWSLDGSSTILEGHADGVRAIAFSPNGKRIASGGDDQMIKLWSC